MNMNVEDLIDINQEVVEVEEPQLGQIPRNPKVYVRRINPFEEYDDSKFKQIYRISKNLAENIINMVHQQISVSNRGGGISPGLQVLTTIRYLAKGAYEQDIGDIHGISQSSMSNIITRVVRAIAAYREQYISFPEGPEVDVVKEDFFHIGNCPSIVGAIDCTHIKIKCPGGDNPLLYINRKGYYSLNVQVVCDAKCKIRDIVARWRGSSHDSRIWSQCSLRRKFENGEINGILLGDNGYTCTRYLLTPLLNPVTDAEEAYNRSHIRTRNVIERLFGQWKNKFRCFFNGMQVSLDTAKAAIIALAIIHNMCIDDNQENSDVDSEDEDLLNPRQNEEGNLLGAAFRQQYIQRYFRNHQR
ncbi:putative nuclease HARBI1 [Anoplophora glabripennis]|uniref:putative nuclease HARBI1 n=1 Tax=Anoplophora glabripennis TaxID=217634 RepID=UPI000874A6AF|nr:putative nuclease HARBI1 [Anoplophora glabripennis]XP_018565348.1 putative nuclease HARBI1 [Anoplophora glabripennis]XP_023313220.1 putative nuclease HARBI1 [Anoplophora glabripennis]